MQLQNVQAASQRGSCNEAANPRGSCDRKEEHQVTAEEAAADTRAEILGSADATRYLRERQRRLSSRAMLLAEIRAFDITCLGTEMPELEGWHY
jgi:hypothetical protein